MWELNTGLAWAICEYLVEVTRAPTLFATHFHELTVLEHSTGPPVHGPPCGPPVGIKNFHVSAHIDKISRKLTMLYKVSSFFSSSLIVCARYPPASQQWSLCQSALRNCLQKFVGIQHWFTSWRSNEQRTILQNNFDECKTIRIELQTPLNAVSKRTLSLYLCAICHYSYEL